jgi:dTDP-4-dehydrorhamnose 3,5-epimerase
MQVNPTKISEVLVFVPRSFEDFRGLFSETYKKSAYFEAGVGVDFLQDNRSVSLHVNTIRGLHLQTPPFAQAKLVSVQHGRVYDIAVDLRRSSPTFLQHVGVELTAERGEQLFIPAGFAHGFCTLEPNTVVTYKVDQYYAPANEAGFHWQTPELAIDWPCRPEEGHLSAKDAVLPDRIDPAACFP